MLISHMKFKTWINQALLHRLTIILQTKINFRQSVFFTLWHYKINIQNYLKQIKWLNLKQYSKNKLKAMLFEVVAQRCLHLLFPHRYDPTRFISAGW